MIDQILVVSSSGKPIYYKGGAGETPHLATIAGVIQTLVEVINQQQDTIRYIRAGSTTITFYIVPPLTLVHVTKNPRGDVLRHIHNLLLFILTETQLKRLYNERPDVDLRRVLAGSERLLDYLSDRISDEAGFFLSSIQYIPMESNIRASLAGHIAHVCKHLKELVFGVVLAPAKDNTKVVVTLHKPNYYLLPDDLLLLINLVECTESYKSAEGWTPVCLPKFDRTGFLHAHVSYLADDCQACLMLLTVNKDTFYQLSEAKQKLVERIRRAGLIDAINLGMTTSNISISQLGIPELRHFLYMGVNTQGIYIFPNVDPPYNRRSLIVAYEQMLNEIVDRKLKLMFNRRADDVLFAWITIEFRLFFVLEPMITKDQAAKLVGKVVHWIKNQECLVPREDFVF